MTSLRKKVALSATVLALAGSGLVVSMEQASAQSSCNSVLQEREQTGLNAFRAGATCSRIDANRKARAWLVRDGGPDYYSQYFTRTNTYYYTNWYTCYAGCRDSYQVAPV